MPPSDSFLPLTARLTLHQSAHWHTNTGLLRGERGFILVDPGILRAELEEIADFAAPAGVSLGLATHAHWDHLLWHPCFGADTPRFASETAVARIQTSRASLLAEMAAFEKSACAGEAQWERDLLFCEQPLAPGSHVLDGLPCQLIPLEGHSAGQCGFFFPEDGVLFCADTLSDEEVPTLESGPDDISLYLQSLDALEKMIISVKHVVPGHGRAAEPEEALRRLAADRAYLQRLSLLNRKELAGNLDAVGRRLMKELGEKRASSVESWSMHLENLALLKRGLGDA